MPLQQRYVCDLTLLEARPQHLARMFPRLALVDENAVPEIRAHLIDSLPAETPLTKIRREHGFDVLRVFCGKEIRAQDIVMAGVAAHFLELGLHVGQQAVLFDCFDLGPPEPQAEGKGRLAPFGGETAVACGRGAEATSGGEGVVYAACDVDGEEGEGDVCEGEDGHNEVELEVEDDQLLTKARERM